MQRPEEEVYDDFDRMEEEKEREYERRRESMEKAFTERLGYGEQLIWMGETSKDSSAGDRVNNGCLFAVAILLFSAALPICPAAMFFDPKRIPLYLVLMITGLALLPVMVKRAGGIKVKEDFIRQYALTNLRVMELHGGKFRSMQLSDISEVIGRDTLSGMGSVKFIPKPGIRRSGENFIPRFIGVTRPCDVGGKVRKAIREMDKNDIR